MLPGPLNGAKRVYWRVDDAIRLAKLAHRSRVFDGHGVELNFDDRLDLDGCPVNPLALAENVADVVGGRTRINVKAVGSSIGHSFAEFSLLPDIESHLDVLGQLSLKRASNC